MTRSSKGKSGQGAARLEAILLEMADPEQGRFLQRFFKTGPGEYGEGDRFLGIRVPELRRLARQFRHLSIGEVKRLLHSPWHEARLTALLIWVLQYQRGDERQCEAIYRAYLASTARINNWDLVDVTAPHIVGQHLLCRDRSELARLARSRSLWRRRIALLATHTFIRQGEFDDTLRLAEQLLADREELIHKAAGWMLREVGKRDRPRLDTFLQQHAAVMPRTMLRYAIEKHPQAERSHWLGLRGK